MSAFLGKIHYWLYDKIKLHEKLIENVTELAEINGYDSEALLSKSYSRYGSPVTGLLEGEIDHTNIHSWLQERIVSVESRLAYVLTELLKTDSIKKEDIGHIFYKSAISTVEKLGINKGSPEDFFKLIFDYMLEGMPCDRVNKIIENSKTMIIWETTRDLHKVYWDEASGDINNYYYFKDIWINGFLSASGTGYKYTRKENGINTIKEV